MPEPPVARISEALLGAKMELSSLLSNASQRTCSGAGAGTPAPGQARRSDTQLIWQEHAVATTAFRRTAFFALNKVCLVLVLETFVTLQRVAYRAAGLA